MSEMILQDHEVRIRKLEESDIKQQIQSANIEKSQAEIKLLINEISKEQRNTLNDFTDKILTSFTYNICEDNKTKNKVKFYRTKQFWALISSIATAVITYFITKH